jgi:hypothetical protein
MFVHAYERAYAQICTFIPLYVRNQAKKHAKKYAPKPCVKGHKLHTTLMLIILAYLMIAVGLYEPTLAVRGRPLAS